MDIRYIFNDGKTTPDEITFEEYKRNVYNSSKEIEDIIRTTSYEELEKNPLGLNYDTRTQEALDGNAIEEIDTRSQGGEQGIDGQNDGRTQTGNSEGKRGTAPRPPNTESAEQLDSVGKAPPKDKPITLVFGGSYSPIHTGHIDAALAAVKAAEAQGYTVERILIAPSPDTLLKAKAEKKGKPEDFIPMNIRAEMARLMIKELGHNIEVTEEPSAEADNFKPTKEEPKLKRTQLANWARGKYPETTIVNVSGADQIADMSGAPKVDALPAMFSGTAGSHEGYFYLGMPRDESSPDNKSSSAVRTSLKEGKGVPAGYMTPDAQTYFQNYLKEQTAKPASPSMRDIFREQMQKRKDAEAAKLQNNGLADALKDIAEIMGDTAYLDKVNGNEILKEARLLDEPEFDTAKFTALKKPLDKAFNVFAADTPDINDQMGKLIDAMTDAGMSLSTIEALEPYFVRFMEDKTLAEKPEISDTATTGEKRNDAAQTDQNTETSRTVLPVQQSDGDSETSLPSAREGSIQKPAGGVRSSGSVDTGQPSGNDSASEVGATAQTDAELTQGLGQRTIDAGGESAPNGNRGGTSLRDSVKAPENFTISDELDFERFSPKEMYRKNADAIRLVKTLEAENRNATSEEQKVLAEICRRSRSERFLAS